MPLSNRLPFGLLIVAHWAVNLLWLLPQPKWNWIWFFVFGVDAAQVTLVAMWYTWRAVTWPRRFTTGGLLLAALAGTLGACFYFAHAENTLEGAVFVGLLVLIGFVWQSLGLFLWRKVWGHRLVHVGDEAPTATLARRQFTLAEVGLFMTGLCFLLAAGAPYLVKLANPGTGWALLAWIAVATVVAGLFVALAAASLALLAGWSKDRRPLIVWLAVALFASVAAGVFFSNTRPADPGQLLGSLVVGEFFFGIVAGIVPTIAVLRSLGYRVERDSTKRSENGL